MTDKNALIEAVQDKYGAIARGEQSGCGCASKSAVAGAIGYTAEELALAGEANLGLGCGNPLAIAEVQEGMTVLDLGSGAGFDAFLAARRVGATGRVIGVDMTDDMLARARENAKKIGFTNVEFCKGKIEKLPLEDSSVDLIISNCVINLSTDKPAVFREMARVLKPGGRFAVSDLVLLADLPPDVAQSVAAYVGCVAGASSIQRYILLALDAGFIDLSIPQIAHGSKLVDVVAPEGSSIREAAALAARAVASIKLHGTKPAR